MEVRINEPMKAHTSFKVGGPADWFVMPETKEELFAVLDICRRADLPWYMLGNGSNLLISDSGLRGVVISTKKFDRLDPCDTTLRVGAGVLLSRAAAAALKEGLTGLEFAAGIPGTVGGAVVMNAGAYGSEMKDVLKQVTVLDREGTVLTLSPEELKMGYRTSRIPDEGYLVLEAEFLLNKGDKDAIKEQMDELAAKRREKQPLEYPSAGSTFKRPAGHFAGKLIEDAGLKGFTVGGAAVSDKHAGFVINKGGASAADIASLCRQVQAEVLKQTGIQLELEIRLLGDFKED